jgi:hypothetical protein
MPRILVLSLLLSAVSSNVPLGQFGTADAQTVWSGLSFTFSNTGGPADLPQNQDRITDDVWLTRNSFGMGLLNAATECESGLGCMYSHNSSPQGTRWANGGMTANVGKTIAASNWQELAFTDWEDSYQNAVGGRILLPNYRDVVVHLVGDAVDTADDIYLDLRFTGWPQRTGGFSYVRAVAPSTMPTASGDYNENGEVDAADYVLWRDTLNQTVTPAGSGADGDRSGTVDAADYDFWKARFGNMTPIPGVGAVAAAIPEPVTSQLLITLAIATFFTCNRKGRGPLGRGVT